jgi:molybdopterin converting factor subunit 1
MRHTVQIESSMLDADGSSGYNFGMSAVSTTLRVSVLFFGRLREICGISEEQVNVPEGATIGDVFAHYVVRFPQIADFRNSVVGSRNQEFAAWDSCISAGDEIAFLPPVSGG